jgi:sulfur relay (sulfurtransferase) DsrF/TusC family protein
MAPSIIVVIRDDPRKTARAVEGLRIALGLSTGSNPLSVVLLDQAPLLLTEDPEDVMDGDILERHLPALKEQEIAFLLPQGASKQFEIDAGFRIREVPSKDVSSIIAQADRVLVF